MMRLLVLALSLLTTSAVHGSRVPELRIEAPEELSAVGARAGALDRGQLEAIMRMVGLEDPGPPIRVVLAPEGSDAARHAPPWASGYTYGRDGVVVLIPARTPSYPDDNLKSVLRHEVAHVLIARAANDRAVPRWFNEGVAMIAGRGWELEDRARMVIAMLPGRRTTLAELDGLFEEGWGRARLAYTISGAFVEDLIATAGARAPGEILRLVGKGKSFEEAFVRATGMTLAEGEAAFWKRQTLWNRWIPVLTSSVTIWVAISLLALYAARMRRMKDARIRRRWEEEDWVDEPPPRDWLN